MNSSLKGVQQGDPLALYSLDRSAANSHVIQIVAHNGRCHVWMSTIVTC
jgi:hypothetical protein